jgi:tetratricopeptide (TPR) repeat protein
MCAWGEAWALGPNLNGGGGDEATKRQALSVARQARRLARQATPMQRQMMDALIQRYSGRTESQGVRFARSMDRIAGKNPDVLLVSAVTADAWMLTDFDWWTPQGKPRTQGVERAMSLLEHSLAIDPNDPGAIHLYIHLTEWSDDPHKAIPYGERLAQLAPGASHLVHMPSHTFYRVGRYKDAMNSNVEAVALDRRYDALARPPGGIPGMPLHGHNLHFGMGAALMAGGQEQGLALADWFLKTYPDTPETNVWRQIITHNAYAIYGRFGSQGAVEALREPPRDNYLLRVSWHYARGESAARRQLASDVRKEAEAIATLIATTEFKGPMLEQQRGFVELSQRVLEGRAAMIDGDAEAAIRAYSAAAAIQARSGNEGGDPPVIWFPTRRSLAAALLMKGDALGAKAKIEELLRDWPNDPYSYFVLAEAEASLGNPAAARAARVKSGLQWVGGNMSLELA